MEGGGGRTMTGGVIKCAGGPVLADCVELHGEWVFRMRQGMDGRRKVSSGKAVSGLTDCDTMGTCSLSLATEA